MTSFTHGKRKVSRRVAAGLVVLAVAAPVALASSASERHRSAQASPVRQRPAVRRAPAGQGAVAGQGTVHAYVDRSGTVVVSGYDGGAALAPAGARP